jgi:hypothetical protein
LHKYFTSPSIRKINLIEKVYLKVKLIKTDEGIELYDSQGLFFSGNDAMEIHREPVTIKVANVDKKIYAGYTAFTKPHNNTIPVYLIEGMEAAYDLSGRVILREYIVKQYDIGFIIKVLGGRIGADYRDICNLDHTNHWWNVLHCEHGQGTKN